VTAPRVLLVSKPLAPPWNDGGKVVPRDVALHGAGAVFHVLVPRGASFPRRDVVAEPVYRGAGAFAPGLVENARVLARLCRREPEVDLLHFFFAPNPRTCAAARVALRLRRRPAVQTILSRPARMEGVGRLLFGDRVVALSHAAAAAVRAAGGRVDRVIPPGLDAAAVDREAGPAREEEDEPVVLFPGDPGPPGGARELVRAFALMAREVSGARLVLAMRAKTASAAAEAEALRREARALGLEGRAEVLGEVPEFRARLRSASIVALPAADLRGKLDYPYVLLEAMALGRPVVVSALPSLVELLALGGGDAPGLAAPVGDVEALARALERLLRDPSERRARGAAGAALVRDRLDPRAAAASYVELYRELA